MATYGPRLRVVSKKIHFLDCNCECDKRRFELQRVLDTVHVPGLACESRSFNTTVDRAAVTIKYAEYRAIGHPKSIRNGEFGHVGDIFIDLTPLNHKLYAKVSLNQWEIWPGPLIVSNPLRHPLFPRQTLSCWLEGENQTLGWHTGRYSTLKDYNTPLHNVIATCLASHSPQIPKSTGKRKLLSYFDFNDGPQAKKTKGKPTVLSGGGSSMSSISNRVWRGLPTTVFQNRDSTRGETSRVLPAPNGVSTIIMSHLVSTTSTTPPRLLQGPHDIESVQPARVACTIAPGDADVDAPVRAYVTEINGPSVDVSNPPALMPTLNGIKAVDVHTSTPPEAPVFSSEPCTITCEQPIVLFGQPNTTNSDPIPDTMSSVGNHPIVIKNLIDPVVSVPNPNEVVARECIHGKSFVPASQSDNASPPISRSQGSPELGLDLEDSANGTLTSAVPPERVENSDQASTCTIPQINPISSEVLAKNAIIEVEEGTAQQEFTPDVELEIIDCDGPDVVNPSKTPPVRNLRSIPSEFLEANNDDVEENSPSVLTVFGHFPRSPPGQTEELAAMHKEDRTLRGFLSNEEHNPPSNSPTSAPSISPSAVDVKSDIGEREDVRPTEASAIDDPNPRPLPPTDLDRWRVEVVYDRSEMQAELICRLCLASSTAHILVLPADTPFHILVGHCREDHAEYYDLLMDLDVDQLQAIQTRLGGLVS